MLHGQDLLRLVVGDVQRRNGSIRPLIEVTRASRMPPVRCALSKVSAKALEKWIASSGKKRTDYLFPGRASGSRPMNGRQLSRLLKLWVAEAGLDPTDYGVDSLRRTKALHILKGTGDLQAVRALLGHAKIESTASSVLKQRPTRLRSVEPSISDGVGGPPAHAERSEGMAKKPAQIPTNLQPWIEARRKFHLSHAHVQMARELGMNSKEAWEVGQP